MWDYDLDSLLGAPYLPSFCRCGDHDLDSLLGAPYLPSFGRCGDHNLDSYSVPHICLPLADVGITTWIPTRCPISAFFWQMWDYGVFMIH